MHRLAFPGGVAEWLMATVCKTVRRKSYAGSNPAPTTDVKAFSGGLIGGKCSLTATAQVRYQIWVHRAR